MDKDKLQRGLMTLAAAALVVVVARWFPTAKEDVVAILACGGMLTSAGGLLGAAHWTKPGDTPKADS